MKKTTLIVVAVVVFAVPVIAVIVERQEKNDMYLALQGAGRITGLTLDRMDAIASEGAKIAGISKSAGREVAIQLARTGKIGGEMFLPIIGSVGKYARLTGKDIKAAGADLAEAFADPVYGAVKLNSKVGFLDARTQTLIRNMSASGNDTDAQRALFEKYNNSLP